MTQVGWWGRLSWHDASNSLAGIAERAGYRIRPNPGWRGCWQVWSTDDDFAGLKSQEDRGQR